MLYLFLFLFVRLCAFCLRGENKVEYNLILKTVHKAVKTSTQADPGAAEAVPPKRIRNTVLAICGEERDNDSHPTEK